MQWAASNPPDSIFFGVSSDGSSPALADYRAYSSAGLFGYPDGSPVFASGAHPANRDNVDPYYSGFGGEIAPASQLALFPGQTGSTPIGTVGFKWRDVSILKLGNDVTFSIDGLLIATVDASTVTLGGDNILFTQFDINASSTSDPNGNALIFGLIDNVRVTAVPEPATVSLFFGASLGVMILRKRKLS